MKNRIKEFRRAKGISQDLMAQDLRISCRTLQRYEKGQVADANTLFQIAEYLGVDVKSLFSEGIHKTD